MNTGETAETESSEMEQRIPEELVCDGAASIDQRENWEII